MRVNASRGFFDDFAERVAGIVRADSVVIREFLPPEYEKVVTRGRYLRPGVEPSAAVDTTEMRRRDLLGHASVWAGEGPIAVPLVAGDGAILGLLAASCPQSRLDPELARSTLEVLGMRAAAELEKLQTAESARRNEQRFRDLFNRSSEGMWRVLFQPPVPIDLPAEEVADLAWARGRIVDVNEAMAQALGYSAGDILNLPVREMAAVDDRRPRMLEVIRNGFRPMMTEFRTTNRRGEVRWLEPKDIPIVSDGQLVEWWGATRDITDRKLGEEILRESEARYRSLFQTAGDAIFILKEGRIQDCNQSALVLFHGSQDDIVGRTMLDFSPEIQPDGRASADKAQELLAADTDAPKRFEWQHRRADGTLFDAAVTLGPLLLEGVRHRLALVRDVSDRRRHERQIADWNERLEEIVSERTAQLEAARQELEAFSYSVSHDLRAAIRGIQTCSQIVLEEHAAQIDEAGRKWLEYIQQDSAQLDKLTLALLDLSRYSRTDLSRAAVDVTALAGSVAARKSEGEPDRRVEWVIAEGLTATADPVLLRVVLENLMGNALKFTRDRDPARIELGAADSRGAGRVYFVRDNGIGFDMRQAGRLFGAFQRLHREGEFEGTGIGLATVRRIVHRHGGRVWAEGAVGKGATIFFTLDSTGTRA
jgi:PAS domain S-box-containing protein